MVEDVGIWKDIVNKNMPSSSLIIQNSIENLSELIEVSNILGFVTNLYVNHFNRDLNAIFYNQKHKNIIFGDESAKIDFHI